MPWCTTPSLLPDEGWRRGLANAVLRNFQRRRIELEKIADEQPSRTLVASRLVDRRNCKPSIRTHWQGILEAGLLHPPFTLRVNGRRGDVASYLQTSE